MLRAVGYWYVVALAPVSGDVPIPSWGDNSYPSPEHAFGVRYPSSSGLGCESSSYKGLAETFLESVYMEFRISFIILKMYARLLYERDFRILNVVQFLTTNELGYILAYIHVTRIVKMKWLITC